MFDLLDRPRVWIPVRWNGLAPDEGGGTAKPIEHEIDLYVHLMDDSEAVRLTFFPEEHEPKLLKPEVFVDVVTDWKRVASGGASVPFSPGLARKLAMRPGFFVAFTLAYVQACAGQVEVREKNSDGSPANGPAGEPNDAATTAKP